MADSNPTSTAPTESSEPPPIARPPALVAIAAWLVPGSGYWLLGLRKRALTVGVTVILLFVLGLLIGGVRVLEVPMYNQLGNPVNDTFLHELRAKPWSIAQIMNGPIAIAAGALSVRASIPGPTGQALGAVSHARLNDIAILYTAVAGMLNLLAIIDSAHRAGQLQENM